MIFRANKRKPENQKKKKTRKKIHSLWNTSFQHLLIPIIFFFFCLDLLSSIGFFPLHKFFFGWFTKGSKTTQQYCCCNVIRKQMFQVSKKKNFNNKCFFFVALMTLMKTFIIPLCLFVEWSDFCCCCCLVIFFLDNRMDDADVKWCLNITKENGFSIPFLAWSILMKNIKKKIHWNE